MSILVGILINMAWTTSLVGLRNPAWLRVGLTLALFGSLLFPLQSSVSLRPNQRLSDIRMQQERFKQEVELLQSQPGPAICEDLLRCYFSGKPYIYDPFNSTSLIESGKLENGEIIGKIERHEYAAIQLYRPIELEERPNNHFTDPIFNAMSKYYVPFLKESDCTIYVPRQL
jgi:hypothetical protein